MSILDIGQSSIASDGEPIVIKDFDLRGSNLLKIRESDTYVHFDRVRQHTTGEWYVLELQRAANPKTYLQVATISTEAVRSWPADARNALEELADGWNEAGDPDDLDSGSGDYYFTGDGNRIGKRMHSDKACSNLVREDPPRVHHTSADRVDGHAARDEIELCPFCCADRHGSDADGE